MIPLLSVLTVGILLELPEHARPEHTRPAPARCSVSELRASPGYAYRPERVRDFVDSATVIVRAVATGRDSLSITWPATADRPAQTHRVAGVSFRVEEAIRGELPSGRLMLPGELVDRDDFNARPVPYSMVRPGGQRGDCFAREYRPGAEYLLLLREEPTGLTPYWWPLAPLNEQVRGATDPWVEWVRAAARTRGRSPR